MMLLMSDFSEKAGKFGIIEPFGLEKWNNEGDRLINVYKQNSSFVFTTCFKQYTLHTDANRWIISESNPLHNRN